MVVIVLKTYSKDYELNYLSDKTEGVKIALKEINNEIKNQNKNDQN